MFSLGIAVIRTRFLFPFLYRGGSGCLILDPKRGLIVSTSEEEEEEGGGDMLRLVEDTPSTFFIFTM